MLAFKIKVVYTGLNKKGHTKMKINIKERRAINVKEVHTIGFKTVRTINLMTVRGLNVAGSNVEVKIA